MKTAKKITNILVCLLFSFTLIILLGCLSVLPIAKSKKYYNKQHVKNNVVEILQDYSFDGDTKTCFNREGNQISYYVPYHKVTFDEVKEATNHIIDYLYHNKVTSMQFQVYNGTEPIDFFSEQAIVHMEDVKFLFISGIKLCFICLVINILCLVYIIIFRKEVLDFLLKSYLITLIVFLATSIGLAILAAIDFDYAFEVFHKVIFPDSSKVELALTFSYGDTLTNVLTEEFFMNIGLIIGITFISLILLSIGADLFIKQKRKGLKNSSIK